MRVISWNAGWSKQGVVEALEEQLQSGGEWIALLQEVQKDRYESLEERLSGAASIAYSLRYREPSQFDADNRRLGVVIAAGGGLHIEEAGVFERCPFPERTLWARIGDGSRTFDVATFHSLTGCDYKRAKSAQFRSLREELLNHPRQIKVIGFDANEPKHDHPDIDKMEFWKVRGDADSSRKLFTTLRDDLKLADSFVKANAAEIEETLREADLTESGALAEPLFASHVVRGRWNRRYDFLMANSEEFDVKTCSYKWIEGKNGRKVGDHAMVIADLAAK